MEPTFDDIMNEAKKKDQKLKNEYKKLLKGLINVTGVFRHLDENTYWEPVGIVDIILTDETSGGYRTYQHARIIDDDSKRLYMKIKEEEIRRIDHYYVWQRTSFLDDDYYGYMLFPLKNGRYFKVSYNC